MTLRFSNGRYEADFYIKGRGTRLRRRFDPDLSEEEARAYYQELIIQYKGQPTEPTHLGLTISQLTQKYLEWYDLFRQKTTVKDARGVFEGPVDRILGAVVAENIFPRHILEYQRKRRDDKVSNRTINKELNYLSGCLRWASSAENGYITPRQWKIGKLPYNKPIPKILSVEETIRILDAAEPFYKAMFLCLYSIGLRMDEARNLKWRDIDRENNTVIVRQKGGSFKRLPLNSMLLAALDDIAREKTTESYIKKIEKFLKENTNKTIEDYIFLNPQTGKPITRIVRAIERACEKAKVEKHVYPHLFRHSVATHMLGQNINLRTIQGYLGHSQISTTEWYTHVLSSHLDKASDTIMAGLMKANNSG